MNKLTSTFGIVAMLLLALFATVVSVAAAPEELIINVVDVKIDGDSLNENGWNDVSTVFQRDSELEVKVTIERIAPPDWYCQDYPDEQICVELDKTIADVQIGAEISGTKDHISAETDPFDVQPKSRITKTLKLKLPARMEDRNYQLRISVNSPNSFGSEYDYSLLIEAPANSVVVKDVIFTPNDKIQAGRALTAAVRLKNYGQKDESDVKVVMSIPSLGVQATDYVDIDKDETVSSEDLLLRIPADAKSGTYDVEVAVTYDGGDEKSRAVYQITVVGDSQAAQTVASSVSGSVTGKTTIAVGVQEQTVARGENGVIYPLTLTNSANVAKTYTLDFSGANDWATTKVTPSNVVILNAGETKQVYVYVAANENAVVGDHVFSIDVKEGNSVVQQIPLKASVLESAKSDAMSGLKNALVAGVILLVVLIVVLGVVILYQNRMKGKGNKEDEQIAQTYY